MLLAKVIHKIGCTSHKKKNHDCFFVFLMGNTEVISYLSQILFGCLEKSYYGRNIYCLFQKKLVKELPKSRIKLSRFMNSRYVLHAFGNSISVYCRSIRLRAKQPFSVRSNPVITRS